MGFPMENGQLEATYHSYLDKIIITGTLIKPLCYIQKWYDSVPFNLFRKILQECQDEVEEIRKCKDTTKYFY